MKELIEIIAKALVDLTEKVSVNIIMGENTAILELEVDKTDLGKIIGRQGRTADAIRTILHCASAKEDKRFVLQIIDR